MTAVLAAAVMPASAEDFFSTAEPEQFCTLGARIGVNTSNRTISDSYFNLWNQNAWGTGFDIGVVADLNIKNFVSIQPGFFYESRSGSFAYQSPLYAGADNPIVYTQLGKGRSYMFTIPVVASFHFNILDELRWNVDCGPYLQIKLKSTFDKKFTYPEPQYNTVPVYVGDVRTAKCDVGLKIGTGLDIFQHYYIGVHYLAGFLHAWNPGKLGGHNKAWMFTIGYNL